MKKQILYRKTDKSYSSTLPRYSYEGPIVVVDNAEKVTAAVEALRQEGQIFGIDTETRPAFHRGEKHLVALLQVASRQRCYLFRLNKTGLPQELADWLADPAIQKVGLALDNDIPSLRQRREFTPNGFLDLQKMVSELGIEDMSLRKLYANVFGRCISKSAKLSNWEAQELDHAQRQYAATDAVTCLHLYDRLTDLRRTGQYELREFESTETKRQAG